MSPINRIGLLAGTAAMSVSSAALAESSLENQNNELRARVAELENRLLAIEAQSDDNWLTEQRAQEIRGLVQDVLADADTRSSMMAQGMTAGYDEGFVLGSSDGNWLLRTNMLFQTRFMFNTNKPAASVNDGTVWGFEVTRARFMLSGHVVDPTWFYRLDIETSTNAAGLTAVNPNPPGNTLSTDPRTGVLNAYVGKDYGNGWRVSMGQFKAPLVFGDLVEAQYQQAVERSYLTYLFTGSYTQGLLVDWSSDQFRVMASYNNGINDGQYGGNINTAGGTGALVTDTAWAFTVRGEWLAMGNWDQFKDYTSPQGEEQGVLVGAAVHVQDGEDQLANAIQLSVLTVDASAEFGGANVYAAFMLANADPSAAGAPSTTPWGFEVGGGWYFDPTWELYGRFEWSDRDTSTLKDLSVLTVGVNKYLSGHNAKWSTDVGFGLDSVPFTVPVTGWRADQQGQDSQFVLRTQFQVLF